MFRCFVRGEDGRDGEVYDYDYDDDDAIYQSSVKVPTEKKAYKLDFLTPPQPQNPHHSFLLSLDKTQGTELYYPKKPSFPILKKKEKKNNRNNQSIHQPTNNPSLHSPFSKQKPQPRRQKKPPKKEKPEGIRSDPIRSGSSLNSIFRPRSFGSLRPRAGSTRDAPVLSLPPSRKKRQTQPTSNPFVLNPMTTVPFLQAIDQHAHAWISRGAGLLDRPEERKP